MRIPPSRFFSGLRFRLLLLVVLASAPPMALIFHSAGEERRRQAADWVQRSQEMVQLANQEEDQVIGQTRQLLLAVAESSQVRSGNGRDCEKLLAALFASHSLYANLGVIKTNGDFLVSVRAPAGPANQTDLQFLDRVVATRAFAIGSFPVGPANSKPTLNVGYPVFDQSGQVVQAVVFATLDSDWFDRSGSKLLAHLPNRATWTEIDLNGTILVRYPEPDRWVGKSLPETTLLKTILTRREGVVEVKDAQGIQNFDAFAAMSSPLVTSNMVGILGIPKQVLFAEADQKLIWNLTWLVIVAGLVLAIGWMSSNYLILRPIEELVKSSARLGSGDLSVRTGLPHGRDELGQLARAFDQMAQGLEQREIERQRAEETLQTRENMIRELPLLPAAVYVCDALGVVELHNRTAVELWGYEPANHYADKHFCGSHKLYHPDGTLMPHDTSPMAEVLRTGNPVRNRELIVERPDGSRVTVLANVVPIREPRRTNGWSGQLSSGHHRTQGGGGKTQGIQQ